MTECDALFMFFFCFESHLFVDKRFEMRFVFSQNRTVYAAKWWLLQLKDISDSCSVCRCLCLWKYNACAILPLPTIFNFSVHFVVGIGNGWQLTVNFYICNPSAAIVSQLSHVVAVVGFGFSSSSHRHLRMGLLVHVFVGRCCCCHAQLSVMSITVVNVFSECWYFVFHPFQNVSYRIYSTIIFI